MSKKGKYFMRYYTQAMYRNNTNHTIITQYPNQLIESDDVSGSMFGSYRKQETSTPKYSNLHNRGTANKLDHYILNVNTNRVNKN